MTVTKATAMQARSSDADRRIRATIERALARGVEWSRINEALKGGDDAETETVSSVIDQLTPETPEEETDDSATSPSLHEKREAWQRLNRVFK